jgi:hypothetical protein
MNSIARGFARVGSAIAATTAVVGIVLGVPVILWTLTADWFEDGLPAGASLVDLALRPDDGTLLRAFLVIVGWGTWLLLTASIVSEIVAAAAGRPAPRIALPGFGWGRSIAAALVATMLGAAPAAMAAPVPGSVTAVSAQEVPEDDASPDPPRDTGTPGGPVHVVAHRDTLWRIAEVALGDPLRWREIYELNVGRVQPDGGRLTESSTLLVGWNLVLPADARSTVTVRPGDTLTGLAAEHLGAADRAAELYEGNTATPQPDGARLTDPDEIRPGWILRLPGADEAVPAPPAAPPVPDTPPTGRSGEPPTPTAVSPPPAVSPDPAGDDGPSTTQSQEPSAATAVPTAPPSDVPADGADGAAPAWTAAALGMSALVGGGVAASLAVRRRRQVRLRPYRHRVAVPTDDDGRAEWSLARPDRATTRTLSAARRLDLVLRASTRPDLGGQAPVMRVRSARLTDTDVLVTTSDGGGLPAPFLQVGDLDLWSLDVDSELPAAEDELAGCCAPFPTLVSIGTDDDRTLMIDLEDRGVLRLGGEPDRCRALLRHLAAELATSTFAEDCEVLLVGFGEELTALNPDRLTVRDLASACDEVRHRTADTAAALERHRMSSAVEGRLRGIAADSWLPTVVLVDPDGSEWTDLEAHWRPDTAVAVVVIDPAAADLVVTDSGTIDMTDVEDGPWRVTQLTAAAGDRLAAVLGATTSPAEPVGPMSDPRSWADGMDDDGALSTGPPDVDPPIEEADDDVGDVDMPARPGSAVTQESAQRLAIVDFQDPHLDDDVRTWRSADTPSVPMIAILGEPLVRAPGPTPTTRPTWFTEVLVYLSLHPAGVTAEKAVTELWPDGHRISPATVRHAFYGARRWAGRGLDGDPEKCFVSDMQNDSTYRIRGHLLDWDLFRRLRKRGQARQAAGHPDAVSDYETALDLIRGPVLTPLRPGGYAWLNNHDQRHDLQIPGFLVDAAHELVDLALDSGDTATARRAAERARLVDVDVAYDRPLTDLMRIAHAEDNRTELELYAAVLLDARGFDVPEELSPDSFAVINELLPAGSRRPPP